jgi:hypothetical protein
MARQEKRKDARIEAFNLIHYACREDSGTVVEQGMGRTLNVSESGIQLETYCAVDSRRLSLSIGIEDQLMEVEGEVIYSNLCENGKFETGIQFIDLSEIAVQIIADFIKAFEE